MLNTKWAYCQMAWDYGPKVRHLVKENQWHYSAKMPSKFLLQTSWWLKTAFLFFLFLWVCISVQLCCWMRMCVCHAFAWRTSWGRLCALCFASVSGTPALLCVRGLPGSREGALRVRLLMLVYARATDLRANVDRPRGPVTAGVLSVSCGPLLTQTALLWEASCCDSLWHVGEHMRARPHKSSVSSGPFLRCCPTRPQQGSPALQGRGR